MMGQNENESTGEPMENESPIDEMDDLVSLWQKQ